MGCARAGVEITDLRDDVFRVLDSMTRDVPPGEATPQTLEAAAKLQSAANLLGEAERCLDSPSLRAVGGELTAA